jgi:hypothetical protein
MDITGKTYVEAIGLITEENKKYKKALVIIRENTAQPQDIKCHDCFIAWQVAKEALGG